MKKQKEFKVGDLVIPLIPGVMELVTHPLRLQRLMKSRIRVNSR